MLADKKQDNTEHKNNHKVSYITRVIISTFVVALLIYYQQYVFLLPALLHLLWSFVWIFIVEIKSKWIETHPWNKYLRDFADIVQFTILVYITGTCQSIFIVGYPIWTIGGSLNKEKKYGFFMAAAGSVVYAFLVTAILNGAIPFTNIFYPSSVLPNKFYFIFSIIFVFLVSYYLHSFIFKLHNNLQYMLEQNRIVLGSFSQSEKKYRSILESINEGYFELDLKGNFTFVNDPICKIFGRERKDVLGLNYHSFMPEEDAKRAFETHNRVHRTGEKGVLVNWNILRTDGTKRFLESSIDLIHDDKGTPVGFRGIVRDISERKKAEDALHESENQLRHFIENASDFIYINDSKGKFKFFNEAIVKFLGYTGNEFWKLNYLDLIPDDFKEEILNFYRVQFKGKIKETYYEHPAVKKNGEVVWVGEIVKLYEKKTGLFEFHCIGRDITDKKNAENALKQSEERYRTILDNINEGYYEVDRHGNLTFFNDAMCEILGRTKEESKNLNFRSFMTRESADIIFRKFKELFSTEKSGSYIDWVIVQKNGSQRFADASADIIVDGNGEKIGFRGMIRDITDKREAELALRKSEEKYRTILESMTEGYFEVDLQGNLTYFNDSLCRVMGYSRAELAGTNYNTYQSEEVAKKVYKVYNRVLNSEISKGIVDYEVITKNGERKNVETSISLIVDENGNPSGFRGVGRDVTERKKAEEALKESEERYRSILENISEGYYEVDVNGSFTFFNESLCKIWGRSPDDMVGLNYHDYLDKEGIKNVNNTFNETYDTGKKNEFSDWVYRGDDLKRFIEISVDLVTDNDGNKTGFRGIARDITEKREADEALRKSEEKYRHIIDNVNDTIYRTDGQGNFLFVSPRGIKEFGFSPNEFLSMNYINIIHPDYKKKVLKFYAKQFEKRKSETYYEFPIVRKDNSIIWIGQNAKLVEDMNGDIEFYCIARNITDRIKSEEIQKELEKQKTRFFANISHEIRTPLTMILSPVESLLQGDYNKELDRPFFESIQRNGLKLLKLINNLLDFSKIEAGRMSVRVKEADVVKFLKNYVGTIQSTADSKNINVTFISPPYRITDLYFDLEKMDKVIMNLFSNSLKFTDKNEEIRIRVRDDDKNCYIEFEDTGIGIPLEKLDIVFDRFRQADSSSTRKYEGTGIGLSLVKEFVEMHGGTISLTSRHKKNNPDNHGTTFIITLPKGREHFEKNQNVEFITNDELDESVVDHRFIGMREMSDLRINGESAFMTHHNKMPGRKEKKKKEKYLILIVEDNSDMRDFLEMLLSDRYTVHTADNGKEGLRKAKKIHPNLIITDVMMPIMNGYELTRKLKENNELKLVPILMITAKVDLTYRIEGLEYGADDYLTKPFNSKELLVRVRSLLKSHEHEQVLLKRNQEIEHELEIAMLIQQKLLPQKKENIPGYASYFTYIPMDKVGGDFFDYSKKNNNIEIYIADVSGHGLSGAFLSLIAKMALESIDNRSTTTNVLSQLNEIIFKSTVKGNFITSFFCMVDTDTNIMRYSSAGHIPPILYRKKDDSIFELNTKGKPLGWFIDMVPEEKEIQLYSGDRIIFFTDGITECNNGEYEFFGEERLMNFIRENIESPPDNFSVKLLGELMSFSGFETFDDDLTFIVFDVL